MTTAIDQLKTITDGMNLYFTQLAAFFTSAGNPVPSFEDFTSTLVYDIIYTDAVNGTDKAPSFVGGALTDLVHQTMAIKREFDMRTKTKSDYYADAITETGITADYYTALYGLYRNYIRGGAPEQGKA